MKERLRKSDLKKTTPGLYADGGGLYLRVRPGPQRSWLFRWRDRYEMTVVQRDGKERTLGRLREMGLGPVDEVDLDVARRRAAEARELVRAGRDPIAERQAARERIRVERLAAAMRMTFDEAAKKAHRVRAAEFKNAKHAAQWLSTLTTYASPIIGALPVDQIGVEHVVRVLEPIWTTKPETASRLRGRIESVLDWAKVSGFRTGDNPARWKGNLDHVLSKPSKVKKNNGGVKHHPALPWERVGEFVAALREVDGMGARALEFAILTAARSGEVRLATWAEIDLEARLWTVPGERMKAGLAHRVPLSDAAVALLKALPRGNGPYVFPGTKGQPLSDMTVSAVVKRMHEENVAAGGPSWLDPKVDRVVVPHGFRSSFKDWARSLGTRYTDEASELALAHVNSDATRAAYARDELLPERTRLMKDWAQFVSTPAAKKGKVVPLRGRRRR